MSSENKGYTEAKPQELKALRESIDSIDEKLVPLLKQRMECSLEIAKVKKSLSLPVYHPEREREILNNVKLSGGEYGEYIEKIYTSIMAESRNLQNEILTENEK